MKTAKKNTIIIKFMGIPIHEANGYTMVHYSGNNERTIQDTHYGNSWDWLIPVVQKCFDCDPIESNELSDITHGLLDCNIDEVYDAVVVYIHTHKQG
jgi:hypothetical protein